MHTAAGNCSMCVYYNRKSAIHSLNEKQNAFLDNKGNRKRQLLYNIYNTVDQTFKYFRTDHGCFGRKQFVFVFGNQTIKGIWKNI